MKIRTRSKPDSGFVRITGALLALLLAQAVLLGGLLAWRTQNVLQPSDPAEMMVAMSGLGGSIFAVFVAGYALRRRPLVPLKRRVLRRRHKSKVKGESNT